MQTDMTVGKPMKMLLNFTIPVFIGNVFQQLYSMADAVIVGKFVGTKGLAAVGATGTITFLIIGFLMGLTTGFTVLTSQKFGAGRMDEMRKTVGNAAILSAVIAVIMTAVSMLGLLRLLVFMHTPEDIFDGAYGYIMIICAGIFTQVLYNLVSSVLRALGNSKTPLYFLILAAGLNIVLDLVFIIFFHWGAPGAAWATVISQGVSGLLCLVYIWKAVPELRMKREDWHFNKDIAAKQISVGIPMGLQYSITAIGTMMVQSSLNILGSYAVAAFTAGNKIECIFTQAFVAIGTTISTYNAQNIGAGKPERAVRTLYYSIGITVGFGVIISIIIQFVATPVVGLFTADAAVVVLGTQYIRGYIWDCIFAGIHFSFSGYFCAIGRSELSFIHNITAIVLVRVPGVYLTSKLFPDTLFPMGLATVAGSLTSVVICLIAFHILKRQKKVA